MALIRSAGLRGLRAIVAEMGGDAEQYAVAAGLSVDALDCDEMLVTDRSAAAVLEIAAGALRCPDLGLRIAARQDISILGALSLAVQHSATVGEVLDCTSRYLSIHAGALKVEVEPDPYGTRGIMALTWSVGNFSTVPPQGADLGLGFLHRALRYLAGGPYGLRSVEITHRPTAPLSGYEDFFGAPVNVMRPAAQLRIPRSLINQPLPGGNEHLRQLAIAFVAEHQGLSSQTPMATTVRSTLRHSMGTTTLDLDAVAKLLAMHPRTLQRKLHAEQTTFGEILDDVRRSGAHRYLTTTDMPMTRIASLLGLSEQSALSRAAQRWWGASPRAVRRHPELAVHAGAIG